MEQICAPGVLEQHTVMAAAQVRIRFLESEDADAVYKAVDESREEIAEWMDWCRESYSLVDAAQWIQSNASNRHTGSAFEFGIFDKDGSLLGACGLKHINKQVRLANLGYWVRTSAAGRGVAVAAVSKLVSWAFTNTDLHRLEIITATANHRSQRVAEKVGAAREGVLKSRLIVFDCFQDAVMYSIIRE